MKQFVCYLYDTNINYLQLLIYCKIIVKGSLLTPFIIVQPIKLHSTRQKVIWRRRGYMIVLCYTNTKKLLLGSRIFAISNRFQWLLHSNGYSVFVVEELKQQSGLSLVNISQREKLFKIGLPLYRSFQICAHTKQ